MQGSASCSVAGVQVSSKIPRSPVVTGTDPSMVGTLTGLDPVDAVDIDVRLANKAIYVFVYKCRRIFVAARRVVYPQPPL